MRKQVLILNITRMGDLVQMGTLLARLQEEWPGAAVDLVVDRHFAPVASMLNGLRDIIAIDFHALIDESRASAKDAVALYREAAGWAAPLHERQYDRLVNLTFNRPSALLADYVGAPDMRGARSAWDGGTVIDHPWMAYFTDIHLVRRINRFNLVDVYAMGGSRTGAFAPLAVCVPSEARGWARGFLFNQDQPAMEWIAVQAGASDVMKAWRPQYFGLTLAALSRQWAGGIVLIGSSSEQATLAEVTEVYRKAGGLNVVKNAAGRTTLAQLAALLAECRLLLTNDTGPMHLAVGVKTPVIDLSVGHVDFQETGPYGPGHWVLQPELDCAPCGFEQVCAHHACKDRIPTERVADLMLHVLGRRPCPTTVSGFRLYQSGIDEDQLGAFRLVAGHEDPTTAWYASFWRRYWYEAFTGCPSRLPEPGGVPPDVDRASAQIATLLPLLDSLCRRSAAIRSVTSRTPLPVQQLQSLQREQALERERAVELGRGSLALAPLTGAFLRSLHNDNVQGLGGLARHHVEAYRQWHRQVNLLHRTVFNPTGFTHSFIGKPGAQALIG
jgi:ADP-heptose:LPS heptosyltransferase